MNTQSTAAPVRTHTVVEAPIERAFEVFTAGIGSWWPEANHIIEESAERTRVELEHRHIERHGDGWESMHGAVDSPNGWTGGLEAFARHLAA